MRMKTDMEEEEGDFIFFSPLVPSISFPKKNKEINSYNIKPQQGPLLFHSSHLKINLIYKDWEGTVIFCNANKTQREHTHRKKVSGLFREA